MRIYPSETPEPGPGQPNGYVPRPSDLPYLIVGIVLGAFVFIIVAFIPFCLWRTWAKQSKCCLQFLSTTLCPYMCANPFFYPAYFRANI